MDPETETPFSGTFAHRKPAGRPRSKLRLVVLILIFCVLTFVWRAQMQDRLDRALMAAVLGGQTHEVVSLLERGASPEVHFGAFSERKEEMIFLEWVISFVRTGRAERKPNDRTVLLIATSSGHTEIASALARHGANVNTRTARGITPLLVAATRTEPTLPVMLLERGADWKVKNPEGLSPVQLSASAGNTSLLKSLIDRGAPIAEQDKRGFTPLLLAAEHGHDDCVRLLLERGAKMSELYVLGPSPFPWAAQHGSVELMARLWESVGERERPVYGKEALVTAVASGNVGAVEFLLARRVPLNYEDRGSQPLAVAAGRGRIDMMKLLIRRGADVRARDGNGNTALMEARGSSEAVKLLLEHGADPNMRDSAGRVPLSQLGDPVIVGMLLAAGAKPNVPDETGATPLHFCYNAAIADRLLQAGADPNAADKQGVTPLMKAVTQLNQPLAALLIKHGARVNEADATGQTALGIARRSAPSAPTTKSIVAELIAKGGVPSVPRKHWRGTPAKTIQPGAATASAATVSFDQTEARSTGPENSIAIRP
jgi:ankyrin repeat protein